MAARHSSIDDISAKAEEFRDSVGDGVNAAGDSALATAKGYRDQAAETAEGVGRTLSATAGALQDSVAATADELKQRAAGHVEDAKSAVAALADEARSKIADIVDQQKAAGADKLANLSRVAQTAAGDLSEQNPQVARLMRDAANSVDRFAGELRSSSLSEVVASVSDFARKQPVAFFAGSVVAGFVLARFLKSEPAPAPVRPRRRARA